MADHVLLVEHIAKKFVLGGASGRSGSLREALSEGAKKLTRKAPAADHGPQEFWALKDISFAVKQGEVVGIVGRNGAGKSTLLKIISRIIEPTKGAIRLRGRVASLLEVGTGFHPELTGAENIFLNGSILGMAKSEIESRFDEIVEFAEIDKFIYTPVKRYSSGMYVRLAFAVAAHLQPDIMIVDEVLAVGDVQFQRKCLDKIAAVAREGRTILFVSHNMGIVQVLCSRVVFLRDGVVYADDVPSVAVGAYLQSIEQQTGTQLALRTDRRGRGRARLQAVQIETIEERSVTLATGKAVRFTFRVDRTLPNLNCIFTIYDQNGQSVANFNSSIASALDQHVPSEEGAVFGCEIDALPLVPGRYRLNVAVYGDGELQDHLEGAALFEVEQGILMGRPIDAASGFGSIHIPHRWLLP